MRGFSNSVLMLDSNWVLTFLLLYQETDIEHVEVRLESLFQNTMQVTNSQVNIQNLSHADVKLDSATFRKSLNFEIEVRRSSCNLIKLYFYSPNFL